MAGFDIDGLWSYRRFGFRSTAHYWQRRRASSSTLPKATSPRNLLGACMSKCMMPCAIWFNAAACTGKRFPASISTLPPMRIPESGKCATDVPLRLFPVLSMRPLCWSHPPKSKRPSSSFTLCWTRNNVGFMPDWNPLNSGAVAIAFWLISFTLTHTPLPEVANNC